MGQTTKTSQCQVKQYAEDVLSGRIPACKWVKLACRRHLHDLKTGAERGLHFDMAVAAKAIEFFPLFLVHSKGEWAGQPFKLQPWQAFVIGSIFGWLRGDGLRRFRTVYEEVPRKNGKSTKAAGVGLKLLVADNEPGAEVYSAATKRDQALIVHSEAVRMVQASAELSAVIEVFKNNLSIPGTASKYEPLGADADTSDGLNPHGVIIDELHAHKTRALVDVLASAFGSRRQPLQFKITTAGTDVAGICQEHNDYTKKILQGFDQADGVKDDSWFGIIYTIDPGKCADCGFEDLQSVNRQVSSLCPQCGGELRPGDDWRDPAVWAKANPNFGISVKPDFLAEECRKAQEMPAAQNNFLRKLLNVWTQQINRWIDLALWDRNGLEPVREADLNGRRCYGGLDLSSVSDITAWIMAFPEVDDPDFLTLLARFWVPEAKLYDTHNRYMEQYQAWARGGWLKTTPGNAIDFSFIKAQILADAWQFDLVDLNVDRLFQAHQLAMELTEEGLQVIGLGQGFLSMATPVKEFQRRLLAGKLRHGGHPVLRWMMDNTAVKTDPAGNLKPDKASSQGKIDGIVASIMALDRAMRHQGQPICVDMGFIDLRQVAVN